jgi:hypothetical protein
VGTDVDQKQDLSFGFWLFLLGKDDPAVVPGGTSMKPGELAAQVMRLQAGIVDILGHASQGSLDLRLQSRVFPDQATKRPLKTGREDEFTHDSLSRTQAGDDAHDRFRLKFAGAQGFDCLSCFRSRVAPPCFNPTLPQEIFQHFLLVGRQGFGRGQNSIQCQGSHKFKSSRSLLCYSTPKPLNRQSCIVIVAARSPISACFFFRQRLWFRRKNRDYDCDCQESD